MAPRLLTGIGEPLISPKRPEPAAALRLLALAALVALTACRAQRHMIFETAPAGATVRLDDEIVGRTPLDLRFEHYGTHQLTIYREGYRTYSEEIRVKTPWYSHFPFDFITEVLLPFGWRDYHRYEIALEPEIGHVTGGDLEAVMRRAEALRHAGPAGPALPAEEPQAAAPEGAPKTPE